MTSTLAIMEAPVSYSTIKIKSLPSLGYELLLGTALAKARRDGCIVFHA